jgi:hypothetical protein
VQALHDKIANHRHYGEVFALISWPTLVMQKHDQDDQRDRNSEEPKQDGHGDFLSG